MDDQPDGEKSDLVDELLKAAVAYASSFGENDARDLIMDKLMAGGELIELWRRYKSAGADQRGGLAVQLTDHANLYRTMIMVEAAIGDQIGFVKANLERAEQSWQSVRARQRWTLVKEPAAKEPIDEQPKSQP